MCSMLGQCLASVTPEALIKSALISQWLYTQRLHNMMVTGSGGNPGRLAPPPPPPPPPATHPHPHPHPTHPPLNPYHPPQTIRSDLVPVPNFSKHCEDFLLDARCCLNMISSHGAGPSATALTGRQIQEHPARY